MDAVGTSCQVVTARLRVVWKTAEVTPGTPRSVASHCTAVSSQCTRAVPTPVPKCEYARAGAVHAQTAAARRRGRITGLSARPGERVAEREHRSTPAAPDA